MAGAACLSTGLTTAYSALLVDDALSEVEHEYQYKHGAE
jgi:hypothetical protein